MISDFKKKYMSIGEFAKICGVSRKTLIFYDNIGVFSPDMKTEKGYRYYGINQYYTFMILLDLRDIGMSLDEIKSYLKMRNPNNYIKLLNQEKEKINSKINKLKILETTLENQIEIAKTGIDKMKNLNPYIEFFNEEDIIISDLKGNSDHEINIAITDFIQHCRDNNIYKGYPIGVIIDKSNLENKNYTNISKTFMKLDKDININRKSKKPSGIYGCINHIGSYDSTYKSYEKLIEFIKNENYQIIGDSYEISLLDFFGLKDESEYVTQIMIPIMK